MNRLIRPVFTVVAGCAMLALAGYWFSGNKSAVWAKVVTTGPGVHIVRDGESRPAQNGESITHSDRIIVPDSSTAQVVVFGLGRATLGPEACLQNGSEPRTVKLESGFVSIAAEKQTAGQPWRILTPQLEASVLGTKFNLASSNGRTALRVSEGLVQMTILHDGQVEQIYGGHRAIVTHGAEPKIATSRPGSVLILTSRDPMNSHWVRFNQILIDKLVNAKIWKLGFRVNVQHYETIQELDLNQHSLVIVSLFDYDVGEPAIERIGLATADVPVICLEPAAYPVLGMTSKGRGVGFDFRDGTSAVEFTNRTHPLSAEYSGLEENIIRGIIGWGHPQNESVRIAHIPEQPDHAVIFGYDTNRHMTTFAAPARRVGLFLDPIDISEQSTESWNLFEAAVDWCVETGESL